MNIEKQFNNPQAFENNKDGFDKESDDLIKQLDELLSEQKSHDAEEQTKKAELIPEIVDMIEGNQRLAGDVDTHWKKEVSWTARDRRIEEFYKSQQGELKKEEDDYARKVAALDDIREKSKQIDLSKNPELSAKIAALEAQLAQQKELIEKLKKDNDVEYNNYKQKIKSFSSDMADAAKDPLNFAVENVLLSHPEINFEPEAKQELVDNVKKELEIRKLENGIKEKLPKDQEKLKNKEEELKKIQEVFEIMSKEMLADFDIVERELSDPQFLKEVESLRQRATQKTKKLLGGDDDKKVMDKSRRIDLSQQVDSGQVKEQKWTELLENLNPEDFGKYKM